MGKRTPSDATRKYKYVGPFYNNYIQRKGKRYDPQNMTDHQIEKLISDDKYFENWFSTDNEVEPTPKGSVDHVFDLEDHTVGEADVNDGSGQ